MKNLFEIHPLTYISLMIAFLTGYFKDAIFFCTLIFIHEFGHILTGFIFKWKLEKTIFFPFGGVTIFNELINKPLIEEFLITIMGPLFQIIFMVLINNSLITFYGKVILIFNLIPIYPLDGSKLLNNFLNRIMAFKISHLLTIYVSYFLGVFFLIMMFIEKEIVYFFSILLLLIKLKEELENHNFIFNKFLYERYLYNLRFRKVKIVSKIENFKKDYYHYIESNNKILEEKEYLKCKYCNNDTLAFFFKNK